MNKLVQGILEFRRKVQPRYRETFAKLALGQKPDALFIACSDSRVVPNLFASTDPGDLFVVRNVGNLVPPCGVAGHSSADESEAAAIEFALDQLGVRDVILCGHSDCGAMHALLQGRNQVASPNLRSWLRHGEAALGTLNFQLQSSEKISAVNHLSQMNVLLQLEHLLTYPVVQERVRQGRLRLHGWWFELTQAEVYAFNDSAKAFTPIDESAMRDES